MKEITVSWDNMKMLEMYMLADTPGISAEVDGDAKTLVVRVE